MAFFDTTWYCNFGNGSSTGYYAVTVRPQNTAAAGVLRRQFTAPAVGSERVFVCVVAGTTANVTDATWILTRGAKTTDGTATWQECTGAAAVNGDLTNTPSWTAATNYTLGAIVKRVNAASYWICSTAGTSGGTEPAWANDTAGTTRHDGAGSLTWTCLGVVGNFTGGQAPHARLNNVYGTNWFASGNTIYVGDNHAETSTAAINLVPNSALMSKILCHNHSGSYPPASGDLMTGASLESTVGNASAISFGGQGSFYVYGLTFKSTNNSTQGILIGQTTVNQIQNWYFFEQCSFLLQGTAASTSIRLGATGAGAWAIIVWKNCTVKFAAVSQSLISHLSQFTWRDTGQVLVSGSSVPTALFSQTSSANAFSMVVLEGLDLSQCTGALWDPGTGATIGSFAINDCKLHVSATVTTSTNTGMLVQLIRCSSAAVAYTSNRYSYEGTETTETSITRVGGAEDPTGQAQSRKIVTNANTQWLRPFRAEPYAVWNAVTGATVTVTVYGTVNSGSLPLNDELFMEVEYLGSSSQPLGSIVTTTKATVLATGASVSSDGSAWNGGGSGGGWSPFKLVATLSSPQPGMVGYLHARVRAAKASTTYYIDPKVTLS